MTTAFLFVPTIVIHAETCSITTPQGIVVSPATPIMNVRGKIYVTIEGSCVDDLEGSVTFFEQGVSLGTKPFSIRAGGRAEEVWLSWRPIVDGNRDLRVSIVGSSDEPPTTATAEASLTVFVDRDTDGDGVPDRLDQDRDNDGLTNDEEAKLGTDPLKLDTDQDGVDDKHDAFPLDPNRTTLPPPPPPVLPSASPSSASSASERQPTHTMAPSVRTAKQDSVRPTPSAAKNSQPLPTTPTTQTPTTIVPPMTAATSTPDVLVVPSIAPATSVAPAIIDENKQDGTSSPNPFASATVDGMIAAAIACAGLAGWFFWKAKSGSSQR